MNVYYLQVLSRTQIPCMLYCYILPSESVNLSPQPHSLSLFFSFYLFSPIAQSHVTVISELQTNPGTKILNAFNTFWLGLAFLLYIFCNFEFLQIFSIRFIIFFNKLKFSKIMAQHWYMGAGDNRSSVYGIKCIFHVFQSPAVIQNTDDLIPE